MIELPLELIKIIYKYADFKCCMCGQYKFDLKLLNKKYCCKKCINDLELLMM